MIGYFTDNNVSQTVMKSFSRIGIKVKHIRQFDPTQQAIFYGILRGTGPAMRLMQYLKKDFWYVDNGYYEAVYMNENKQKEMTGKYRIVKNATIEPCDLQPVRTTNKKLRIMLMPPSPYTAFMHDTTPEDWSKEMTLKCDRAGHISLQREKGEIIPIKQALREFDAVLAFNSLGVVEAMKEGKAVYTTHGIIRNIDLLGKTVPYYDFDETVNFYKGRQHTLQEIEQRGIACLT
jgi:hypothetical protein